MHPTRHPQLKAREIATGLAGLAVMLWIVIGSLMTR